MIEFEYDPHSRDDATVLGTDILKSDFQRSVVKSAYLAVAVGLAYRGLDYSRIGQQRTDENAVFRPERVFARVRSLCTVRGVHRFSVRESRVWKDISGVEREHLFCSDFFVYNFSVVLDPRIERSGFQRSQHFERTCEESVSESGHDESAFDAVVEDDDGESALHTVGDEVDCWRAQQDFASTSVPGIDCGRPLCTLADVYLCPTPTCVQLANPAALFSIAFGDASTWRAFGNFLIALSVALLVLFFICDTGVICRKKKKKKMKTKYGALLGFVLFIFGISSFFLYAVFFLSHIKELMWDIFTRLPICFGEMLGLTFVFSILRFSFRSIEEKYSNCAEGDKREGRMLILDCLTMFFFHFCISCFV